MVKLRLKLSEIEIQYEGKQKHLRSNLPHLLDLAASSHNAEIKEGLREVYESLEINQALLEGIAASIAQTSEEFENRLGENQETLRQALEEMVSLAENPEELIVAARDLQRMNMSFNMQYLSLQQKIQQETRAFNLISNIMKTKHETAKNAVNNIR